MSQHCKSPTLLVPIGRSIIHCCLLTRVESFYDFSVIPSEDAHQSEYVAGCDERRAYISGFTGSAGLAIVSLDAAALFTDGRYFLQASQQLDSNWILMKSGFPDVPTWQEYLVKVKEILSKRGIRMRSIAWTSLNENETDIPCTSESPLRLQDRH